MDRYDTDPRRAEAATCQRCGRSANAGTAARSICTTCGHDWQVGPAEVEPLDVVAGAALSVDRLNRFLHGPLTAAERPAGCCDPT